MEAISQIQQLSYREGKTYALSAAFIAGNILLPQLCHMIPQGGLVAANLFFYTHRGLPLRHNSRTAYGNSVADSQQPAVWHAAGTNAADNINQVGTARPCRSRRCVALQED